MLVRRPSRRTDEMTPEAANTKTELPRFVSPIALTRLA